MGCGSFLFTDKHFNMKQKLLAALEQRYGGALGSKNEIYEKVVTAYGNLITSEEQIPDIVAGVEPLLKQYQSVNDKLRTLEKKNEPPKPSDDGNQPPKPSPEDKPGAPDETVPAWAQAIIDSNNELRESNKALSEKIAGFEAAKAKETAVAALDKFVGEWDYAKGFPKEAAEAKRLAMKLYAKGGENMTAEELIAEFRGEFDPAVKNKGVTDFTKPFDSDGGGADDEADFSSFDRASQKLGWTEKPEK